MFVKVVRSNVLDLSCHISPGIMFVSATLLSTLAFRKDLKSLRPQSTNFYEYVY